MRPPLTALAVAAFTAPSAARAQHDVGGEDDRRATKLRPDQRPPPEPCA